MLFLHTHVHTACSSLHYFDEHSSYLCWSISNKPVPAEGSHVCRLPRREASQRKHRWRLGLLALFALASLRFYTSNPTAPYERPAFALRANQQRDDPSGLSVKHGPWPMIRWAGTGHERFTLEPAASCSSSMLLISHSLWAAFVGNRNAVSQKYPKALSPSCYQIQYFCDSELSIKWQLPSDKNPFDGLI